MKTESKTPRTDAACPKLHLCGCGTSERAMHIVGEHGCVRFMTAAPSHPHTDSRGIKTWLVDKRRITDFTMRQQRGYWQHECGCWSRSPGSENSIEA